MCALSALSLSPDWFRFAIPAWYPKPATVCSRPGGHYNAHRCQSGIAMVSPARRLFDVATAPARFALRQTRTNIDTLRALREDYRTWQPVLQQAADETLENLVRVMVAAEQSLPGNIEDMTPGERRAALTEALARSERHLLAAFGELYRGWRIATADSPRVIENPPQSEFSAAEGAGEPQ